MTMFKDLTWEDHPSGHGGERARVRFENGYGASVLRGGNMFYTQGGTYELAVMRGDGICYDTHITDGVLGYLSSDEVDQALQAISALPKAHEDAEP